MLCEVLDVIYVVRDIGCNVVCRRIIIRSVYPPMIAAQVPHE